MMTLVDKYVALIIAIILIVGFYQFYFWCQRNYKRAPRTFKFKVDDWFTLKPWWIWIYSGLYYPVIVLSVFTFKDFRQFNYIVIDFFILTLMHMVFFVYYPVVTPDHWRESSTTNPSVSLRFLQYIQKIDKNSNCFPSMHVSVATLMAYHLLANNPSLGYWVWLFPGLIAVSTLYTKQHYVVDTITGYGLGVVAYVVFQWMY